MLATGLLARRTSILGNPAGSIFRRHLPPALVWPALPQVKAHSSQGSATHQRLAAGRAQRPRPCASWSAAGRVGDLIPPYTNQSASGARSCLCGEGPCRRLAAWRWRPPGAPLRPRSRLPSPLARPWRAPVSRECCGSRSQPLLRPDWVFGERHGRQLKRSDASAVDAPSTLPPLLRSPPPLPARRRPCIHHQCCTRGRTLRL